MFCDIDRIFEQAGYAWDSGTGAWVKEGMVVGTDTHTFTFVRAHIVQVALTDKPDAQTREYICREAKYHLDHIFKSGGAE